MSIYDTIGGDTSVAETVQKFYAKLKSDPDLAVFFESTDVDELRTRQRMFLTAALGGPDAYEGRDMRAAHAHLKITEAAFDLFLENLAESLVEVGNTPARIAEVLDALEPLRLEIVSAPPEGSDEWGSAGPTGGSG
jgi:hemoglobin